MSEPAVAETTTLTDIPTRVLVLGMAHQDGTIHGEELYPVAEACGQTTEQVRSCLRRLVAEGLFTRSGEGREAVFLPTAAGRSALDTYVERTKLAYAQDAAGRGWDRRWRLVAFAIPEHQRAARDGFRDRLRLLGGAALQNGLYVSPHPWDQHVTEAAEHLGVADHVITGTTDDLVVGGERDPRALAQKLWPLEEVAFRYEEFLAEYGRMPHVLSEMRQRRERLPETNFLPGALSMGVAFQRCFDQDPLLPPELLPRPWPGRTAREVVAESHRLALLAREQHTHPALFRYYAEVAAAVHT